MDAPLIGIIRDSKGFYKTITWVVICTFAFVYYSPSALAIKQAVETEQTKTAHLEGESDEEQLVNALQAIKEHVSKNKDKLAKRVEKESNLLDKALNVIGLSSLEPENIAELTALNDEVVRLDKKAMANFQAIETKLKTKMLPEKIMQRHYDAVEKYQTEFDKLQTRINQLKNAKSLYDQEEATEELDKFLKAQQFKPEDKPFDPNDLPNKSLKPIEDNEPKATKQEFSQAGLFSNPSVKLAALGDFSFDALPGANNPAYLEETIEVRLSDAIKAKAAELEHDPVKIYNWVRNNTEWLPTWGSMQDADLTLSSLKGNAFDIASLQIALLRASGIPSRYIHGTIEVPTDKFMNWAGGFTDIIAAGTFVRSGGVPAVGVSIGGKVEKVRMEHIWVEAAIDYEPSRGAVNRDADTWIEMDPTFKQYEFLTSTVDPNVISGIDLDTASQSFYQSGAINETEGWSSSFNSNILENAFSQTNDALNDYVQSNWENLTVGDLLGGQKIIVENFLGLPSAFKNSVLVDGPRYAKIPNPLQNKVSFALKTDFLLGTMINPVTFEWARLNNRKVTLSFRPASPADEQAFQSLFPEGGVTDPSQLPNSIPAYLINVVPELKLDDDILLQGNAMRLGQNLPLTTRIQSPGHSPALTKALIPAGAYVAIAVIGGSLAPVRLSDSRSRLQEVNTVLASQDPDLVQNLSREDLLGERYYSGLLSYFAQYFLSSHTSALHANIRHALAPSIGTYGSRPSVSYFFGIPRTVGIGGIAMDLNRIATITQHKAGNEVKNRNFILQMGVIGSALEHAVPEQMFSTSDQPIVAISAVKAMTIANDNGQRIYVLTSDNKTTTLPNINHDTATMRAINQALASGKYVVTHTSSIDIPGWSGAGYIVIDPEVGNGGFLISGSLNGGAAALVVFPLLAVSAALLWLLALSGGAVLFAGGLVFGLAIAVTYLAIISLIYGLVEAIASRDFDTALNKLEEGLALVGYFLGLLATLAGAAALAAALGISALPFIIMLTIIGAAIMTVKGIKAARQ